VSADAHLNAPAPVRGDVAVGIGWAILGALIGVASWRMDRLEAMHINPWSAPGLVPGLLGALMVVFGLALAAKSRASGTAAAAPLAANRASADAKAAANAGAKTGAHADVHPGAHADAHAGANAGANADVGLATLSSAPRTLLAVGLCLAFAGGLLGRGLPFVLTAAAFVFVWIVAFQWRTWSPAGRLRGFATAAAIAIGASTLIAYLFQAVFLVRLP
jgi:hypothetical protein